MRVRSRVGGGGGGGGGSGAQEKRWCCGCTYESRARRGVDKTNCVRDGERREILRVNNRANWVWFCETTFNFTYKKISSVWLTE